MKPEAEQTSPMTPTRFRELRERMGVSGSVLARMLRVSKDTVKAYESSPGTTRFRKVPHRIADHLTRLHNDWITSRTPFTETKLKTAVNRKRGVVRLSEVGAVEKSELRVQKTGESDWTEEAGETRIFVMKGRVQLDIISRSGRVRSMSYGAGELAIVEPLVSHRIVREENSVFAVHVSGGSSSAGEVSGDEEE